MRYLEGYFDYNATTPMSDGVMAKMKEAFAFYANPSSSSRQGQDCKRRINLARKSVSNLIGSKEEEIIFTSGGSESNNLAIKGELLKHIKSPGHIIVSSIEHVSVLSIIDYFAEEFGFSVTKISPDSRGLIAADAILESITEGTQLITVMMANNELGSIEPIREIGEIASSRNIYFHVDGVQAAGKMPIDVSQLKLNSLSLSAHKFYGPKGTGALCIRNLNGVHPLIHGGGQEKGIRCGTENVLGIVGMGQAALEANASLPNWHTHFINLRRKFIEKLFAAIPTAKLNGPGREEDSVANTLNVYLPHIRAEAMAALLDHKYHCTVSIGSACSNNKTSNHSHVLAAIGMSEQRIKGSFRISFGQYTTLDDVTKLVDSIYQSYQTLLAVGPKTTEFMSDDKERYKA